MATFIKQVRFSRLIVCVALAVLPSSVYSQTNVTFTVSSNSDDAAQTTGGTMYVHTSDSYMNEYQGYRFQNVTIPPGATITSATLDVRAYGGGTTSFSVDILAEDADSPTSFTSSANNISNRSRTTAQTLWSIGSTSFSDGQVITSPNFSASIQEVIDRAGWSSGNSLVVIATPNSGNKRISQRNRGSAYAPQLHITYTVPTVFYVRPDGNDSNSGTGSDASNAWASVVHAATESLNPGDVVYVMPGTYVGEPDPTVDGASGNPIRFIADRDGAIFGTAGDVTLVAPTASEVLDLNFANYLEFVGFRFQGGGSGQETIAIDDAIGVIFESCEIFDGLLDGVDIENSVITFRNCLIYNNDVHGIDSRTNSTVTLLNCTVVANGGDGVAVASGSTTVQNCIIAYNTDDGLDRNGGTLTHTYNLVFGNGGAGFEGTSASTGEITSDPLFVGSGSYVLQTGSPAIDAGISLAGTVDVDLTGTARPVGSGWDLGCYEGAGASGLFGHWKLDEVAGTTATDSSSSGFDGTYLNGVAINNSGPYPGAGAIAAQFDGSNDSVDLPDMNVGYSSGFSAAFWFNPASAPSVEWGLLGISNGQDVDEIWVGWLPGTGIQLYFSDTIDSSSSRSLDDNVEPTIDRWHHVAISVDASGNAKIYRDGVEVASGFVSLPANTTRTENFIGNSTRNDNFPGKMFDVRVYNRPLTPTEVSDLYGLVGHWAFDEGTGTTIADATNYSNNASFNAGSPAWVDGVYGNALEFDGTNDAVTGANFDPPEYGAVSLWIRSDGPPASRQRPWGVGADFEMWQDTDGLVSFDVSTDGYQGGFITDEPLYKQGRWYHLVGQYDSATESYEIYINGELHKSGTSTWDIQKQAANLLTFGTRTGNTQRFVGALDEFRIYNRWLSVAEINDLYGRIAYWKLDESSGVVAVDSTEHGNDGAYTGIPTLGVNGAFVANTGTAVALDGSSEYVNTGKSLLNNLEAFTMLGWVRADSLGPGQSFFGQNNLIELGFNSTAGQLHFYTENGGIIDSYNQLPAGKWTHVAVTGDGTELKMYLNGVEEVSGGSATGSYGTSSYPFKMGEGVFNATGDYFDGRLDDVQIFDRALKPEEIFPIYRGGRPAGVRLLQWVEAR